MSLTRPHRLLVALACLAAGCAELSVPEPVLEEICRADTGSLCVSSAFAGTTTELLLQGLHFHPGFNIDLGNDSAPELGNFSVRVGEVPVEQVALVPARTPGREALAGVLPGALGMGIHNVELVTPGGRQTRLLDAFRISNPLKVGAVPEAVRVPVEHAFDLSVNLENLGDGPVSEVELDLSQDGSGILLLPPAPAPFPVEAGAVRTLDLELRASGAGEVSVLLETQASANDITIATDGPLRIDLVVQEGASLSITTWVSPVEVSAGEEFELIAEVGCQGQTPALGVGLQDPQLTGSGSVELGPAPSQPVDIPAGSRRMFRWSGVASNPGVVEITLGVVGREAVSGRFLGPTVGEPVVLQIQ